MIKEDAEVLKLITHTHHEVCSQQWLDYREMLSLLIFLSSWLFWVNSFQVDVNLVEPGVSQFIGETDIQIT